MSQVLVVNRKKRKTKPVVRRRRSRRRRRNPTLSVIGASNPRGARGMFAGIQPAIEVAVGAILAQVIARQAFRIDPTQTDRMALGNIGVGLGLQMLGGRFLGEGTVKNLATGAMARGIVALIQPRLPEGLRGLAGVIGQMPSEAQIDEEIQALAMRGIAGELGQSEFDVMSVPVIG